MAEILVNELSEMIKKLPDPNNYHGEYCRFHYGWPPTSFSRVEVEKTSNIELKTATFKKVPIANRWSRGATWALISF